MRELTATRSRKLELEHRTSFAREFKAARTVALQNAEAFDEFLFALERVGSFCMGAHLDLGRYKPALEELASDSPLAADVAIRYPDFHLSFQALYDAVRIARNDAMPPGSRGQAFVPSCPGASH